MPLIINVLGGGHTDRRTDTYTHIPTRDPKQFQEISRMRVKAVHAWFKKFGENVKNQFGENIKTLIIVVELQNVWSTKFGNLVNFPNFVKFFSPKFCSIIMVNNNYLSMQHRYT